MTVIFSNSSLSLPSIREKEVHHSVLLSLSRGLHLLGPGTGPFCGNLVSQALPQARRAASLLQLA